MHIIEISALPNGAHRNQDGFIGDVPAGWAVIPDNIETHNFPFGEVTVSDLDGVMTVIGWAPGAMPEPEPAPDPSHTLETRVDALETIATENTAAMDALLTGEE